MNDEFIYEKPRFISKQELSSKLGYYSSSYFFRKVNTNNKVFEQLKETGYTKTSKCLTPIQMEIICEYYGYPIIKEK